MRDATQVADITDEDLMALIRDRDAEALATLYDRYRRVAFSLAYRILNDVGKAEDVLQESFLAIWRQAATYQSARGHPRGWVLTIVRNRAINALRRDRIVPGQRSELQDDLLDTSQPEIWQVAFETIRSDEVREALARLPNEQRLVVDLAFFGGLSHAEISERLVVPLGTVKSRIRLAFSKLQSVLAGYAPEARA